MTIRWGMVGGAGGFIGGSHRMGAQLDGHFALVAGALSSDAGRGREAAAQLGLAPNRTYSDYRLMATEEARRADGIEAVTIVTPNASHHAIAAAFIESGIHVICDKPLATSLTDAADLLDRAQQKNVLLGVTYNYSGYPLVRQARALVEEGMLGRLRLVQVEFLLGWLSVPLEREGVKQAWRTDPALAGPSGVVADIGTHAYHLVRFVTGLDLDVLSADVSTFVEGRALEDNADIMMRFRGGARGALWASMVAAGETVGFRLRVYGEKGSLSWDQSFPDQLRLRLLNGTDQTIHRGGAESPHAKMSTRLAAGLPEGFVEAFANLYRDYAELIVARREARPPNPLSSLAPMGAEGVEGLAFVDAVLRSAAAGGRWTGLS
ncbi:Gfo/Idh/MocA family oxidoreductase [soil metagenome]